MYNILCLGMRHTHERVELLYPFIDNARNHHCTLYGSHLIWYSPYMVFTLYGIDVHHTNVCNAGLPVYDELVCVLVMESISVIIGVGMCVYICIHICVYVNKTYLFSQ